MAFAAADGRAIVTHNRSDFEQLHLQYFTESRNHSCIIVASVKRDLGITRDRILDLVNRLGQVYMSNQLLFA